jgi:hypothetical protein
VLASLRPVCASEATRSLTSPLFERCATSTASAVSTTVTSSRPDDADQPAGRVHERVARIAQQRIAMHRVAVVVVGADLPDRVPGAEVAPAGVERDHADRDTRTVLLAGSMTA